MEKTTFFWLIVLCLFYISLVWINLYSPAKKVITKYWLLQDIYNLQFGLIPFYILARHIPTEYALLIAICLHLVVAYWLPRKSAE